MHCSQPASSRFPHFNGLVLEKNLENEGISYLFLGEELGGRPDDPAAYGPDGTVDYRARRKSYAFRAGIERVERELQGRSLALMCAEEDPIECHRFLMICPELVALGLQPRHIRKDGSVETQQAAECPRNSPHPIPLPGWGRGSPMSDFHPSPRWGRGRPAKRDG